MNNRAASHLFLLLCLAATLAIGLWMFNAELEVVSLAIGEVTTASQVQKVQHLEGGIVAEIRVQEGDTVEAGRELVVLESTSSRADAEELRLRLRTLRITIARLEGEAAGQEQPKFDPELEQAEPEQVQRATETFSARRSRIRSEVQVERQGIAQRRQEIDETNARLAANREVLRHLEEQIGISEKLMQRELSNRMTHVERLKEAAAVRGRIEEDRAAFKRLGGAIEEAEARIRAITDGFQEKVRGELEENWRGLSELTQRLRKFEDSLQRTVLRAPMAGTVKTLYVAAHGEVVKPGATVVDLVPANDRLVVEAKLPIGDIGFVQTGQPVQLRLATADAARFGHLAGEVRFISPDSAASDKGVPYFPIRIEPQRNWFEGRGLRYDLHPGMLLNCAIVIGRRSVLDYLLDPLRISAQTALRER